MPQYWNWIPVRAALESAYRELGKPVEGNLPEGDWALVSTAINYFIEADKPKCVGCRRAMYHHETIRCLDCKSALCELCAPRHFWPNGRPADSHQR